MISKVQFLKQENFERLTSNKNRQYQHPPQQMMGKRKAGIVSFGALPRVVATVAIPAEKAAKAEQERESQVNKKVVRGRLTATEEEEQQRLKQQRRKQRRILPTQSNKKRKTTNVVEGQKCERQYPNKYLHDTTAASISIRVPSGKLGIGLRSAADVNSPSFLSELTTTTTIEGTAGTVTGGAIVTCVQPSGVMAYQLRKGDHIIAIDGTNITRMDSMKQILDAIAQRIDYRRQFTVLRHNRIPKNNIKNSYNNNNNNNSSSSSSNHNHNYNQNTNTNTSNCSSTAVVQKERVTETETEEARQQQLQLQMQLQLPA